MSSTSEHTIQRPSVAITPKGQERVREILAAARAILTEVGYAELSMRSVAARIGVTLGNIQHYYKTKDQLIEALLVHSFENYQAHIDGVAASLSQGSASEQLAALADYFIEDIKSASTQRLFLEVAALAVQDAKAAAILDRMMARARRGFKKLVREIDPTASERELNSRSALIAAQILGLTFQLSNSRRRHADLTHLEAAVRSAVLDLATKRL